MPRVTLYNALNGLSCVVDAGKGLRAKSWLEELSRWAKECVEPTTLAGLGLGRLANFPSIIDGTKMSTRAMGEALVTPAYFGVEIFECIRNTIPQVWIDAFGAQAAFGVAALTQGDPAQDNYGVAANVSGVACAPVNSIGYPAFLLSDAENYALNGAPLVAGGSILSIIVNGVTYTVPVGAGAATTAEQVLGFIHAANVPVRAVGIASGGDAIDQIRLMTLNSGRASTLQVPVGAADCGSVIFATAAAGLALGYGGPLNSVQGATAALKAQIPGVKFQRRILPGSVTLTVPGLAATPNVPVVLTDNRAGVLSNLAGTSVGTIVYATGAITMTLVGAIQAAQAVQATFKALEPVELWREVRLPEDGAEFAIRLLP